ISPRSMVRFTWFRTVVKSSPDGYCRETPLSERSGVSLMSETVRGRNGNLIIGDDFVPLVQTRTDFGVDLVGIAGFDRAYFDLVCAIHLAFRGLVLVTRELESGHKCNLDIFIRIKQNVKLGRQVVSERPTQIGNAVNTLVVN